MNFGIGLGARRICPCICFWYARIIISPNCYKGPTFSTSHFATLIFAIVGAVFRESSIAYPDTIFGAHLIPPGVSPLVTEGRVHLTSILGRAFLRG